MILACVVRDVAYVECGAVYVFMDSIAADTDRKNDTTLGKASGSFVSLIFGPLEEDGVGIEVETSGVAMLVDAVMFADEQDVLVISMEMLVVETLVASVQVSEMLLVAGAGVVDSGGRAE